MIKLKLFKNKQKIDVPDIIKKSFNKPIIYYIRHKNDPEKIFATFIIIDFQKQELNYYSTYEKNNIKSLNQYERGIDYFKTNTLYEPHCVITINNNEFILFYENRSYFYKINLNSLSVKIISGDELKLSFTKKPYIFGSTFYKDPEDENYFYFTISDTGNIKNKKAEIHLYRSDLNFKDIKLIYREPVSPPFACPHTSRKYKKYIFDSVFYFPKYYSIETGEKYKNRTEMISKIFESIYKSYCLINKIEFCEDNFTKEFEFEWESKLITKFHGKFKIFIELLLNKNNFKSPFEFIQSSKYKIGILPGEFYQYDIKTGKKEKYTTKFGHPAHFEIDELKDEIFVSSHNFIRAEQVNYTGVAAIDKFVFTDKGILLNKGTFTNPRGFRFATHRVFHNNGIPYLCIAGEPSRIFFVRTSDMELEYYIDVEPNNLSDYKEGNDVLNYVNYGLGIDVFRVRAVDISDDGKYIFVVGAKSIYIIDFELQKIVHSINFMSDKILKTGENLLNFINNTTHSQIIEI